MFAETSKNESRHLILMRHGEASGSPDIARQLTAQGKSQARAAAKALISLELVPDIIICSGLDRTRQTLSEMNWPNSIAVIDCGEDLYRAEGHKDILNILAELIPTDKNLVLVLGHNPTIHQAVLYLSRESRGPKFGSLEHSYPSGTASVFEVSSDDWDMLHPSTCHLSHFISSI